MAYLTSGMQGVDLTKTRTSAEGPEFRLGTTAPGTDASEWMYVRALSTVAQYDAVAINLSSNAVPVTTANISVGQVGFAQTAIASTSYGWVALQGNAISVTTSGTTTIGKRLYTGATAGILSVTVVTIGAVHGILASTSISAVVTATGIVARNPHFGFGNAE